MLARIERDVSAAVSTAIAGEHGLLDRAGALFLPGAAMLVVSDLHLEKGSSFARRGSMLPPYDTMATLARLAQLVEAYDPASVVCLGDSFHDGEGAGRMPEPARAMLATMMTGRQWLWIAGNHDPEPPRDIGGDCAGEIAIGSLRLRHEPARGHASGEVAGHLHPGARIVRRGRSVRCACFAGDGHRLIMPAFGAYTGTLNVMDRAYSGIFDRARLRVHMLGRERLYMIAASELRPG